ncbi:MAG: spore cortex biosynthesis protein YabQ, partial [Niameybacter sp.]
MGMLYDLVRIFRKIIPHSDWSVQVEDTAYWICCALIGFAILYMHNYGQIRFFVFIGIILGGIFYFCTFSIVFMKFATWMIEFIKHIIRTLIHILSIPILWIINIVKIPLRMFRGLMRQMNKRRKLKMKKVQRQIYFKKADIKSGVKYKHTK